MSDLIISSPLILPPLHDESSTHNTPPWKLSAAGRGSRCRWFFLACGWMIYLWHATPDALAQASNLQGAAAVLKAISDAKQSTNSTAATPPTETAKLRQELKQFTSTAETLTPESAAAGWLALADRLNQVTRTNSTTYPSRTGTPPPTPAELLQAIPSPRSWESLAKLVEARPEPKTLADYHEFRMRMISQALKGDRTGLIKNMSVLEGLLASADREENAHFLRAFGQIDNVLLQMSDDTNAVTAGVVRQLKALEKGGRGGSYLSLPNLVSMLGEEAATPLVRRAVLSPAQNIYFDGDATRALARKITLESVNELTVPRWSLVDSLDSMELYEALDKKFTKPVQTQPASAAAALEDLDNSAEEFAQDLASAKTYYLMALIAKGRTEKATELARSGGPNGSGFQIHPQAVSELARVGYTRQLDDFFFALLTENPALPYWDTFFNLAAQAGSTDRMLQLARTAATKPGLTKLKSQTIRANLYKALLAADKVDEAVTEIRTMISTPPSEVVPSDRLSVSWSSRDTPKTPAELGLVLAQIGHLLQRSGWVNEGLSVVAKSNPSSGSPREEFSRSSVNDNYIRTLVATGRFEEVERVLQAQLVEAAKPSRSPQNSWRVNDSRNLGNQAGPLSLLASLYHRADRNTDVLLLLERSSEWGMKDLAERLNTSRFQSFPDLEPLFPAHSFNKHHGDPLLIAAAHALAKGNRGQEALALVNGILQVDPGNDRAYEILLLVARESAIATLDAVFARDPFEERPLIWKALLLRQAGRLEEAEKVARQAIAIDPSDGEQGKGDRMRVYSVLADIREARGDTKEASILRGAVKAIRRSEEADDFIAAGLLARGVKMYEESLQYFQDAYCIQSRLAVHLSELGQHEQAALHYEKAFELMPDSFGRMESHCFGCESTFAAPQAQTLAEKVFARLLAKSPQKPQLHYLMGYLREQQSRGKEAIPHFKKAIELDPDYLNAWKHLESLGREHGIPGSERDNITLNLLRLDPLRRHTEPNLGAVINLQNLWTALESANRVYQQPPKQLLALTASAEEINRNTKGAPSIEEDDMYPFGYRSYPTIMAGDRPGVVFSRHPLLLSIAGFGNPGSRYDF